VNSVPAAISAASAISCVVVFSNPERRNKALAAATMRERFSSLFKALLLSVVNLVSLIGFVFEVA
jgi:hypothetical protein